MKKTKGSEEIIDNIRTKDRWTLISVILFLLTLLATQAIATWYILERIGEFERGIDCKLLIVPEDRTKTQVQACTDGNKDNVLERAENGGAPSFNAPEDLNRGNRDSSTNQNNRATPQPATPIQPISIAPETPPKPLQPPKPPLPLPILEVSERPFEARIDLETGKAEIKYQGDSLWVEAQADLLP